jgi:hypothetical protein
MSANAKAPAYNPFDDEAPTTERQRLPEGDERSDECELSAADLFLLDLDEPEEWLTPEPRRVPGT